MGLLGLEELVVDYRNSTRTGKVVRNRHQPGEDVRNSHQSRKDVRNRYQLAHLLTLLLHCVPALVHNIRKLDLLWVRIQIFELLRIRLRILEVALLMYNLPRIPSTQVEMRGTTTLFTSQILV